MTRSKNSETSSKDEDVVTLKYIEGIFQRKETVFKIGTSNKGTKVAEPIAMRPPPPEASTIPAAKAIAKPSKGADADALFL